LWPYVFFLLACFFFFRLSSFQSVFSFNFKTLQSSTLEIPKIIRDFVQSITFIKPTKTSPTTWHQHTYFWFKHSSLYRICTRDFSAKQGIQLATIFSQSIIHSLLSTQPVLLRTYQQAIAITFTFRLCKNSDKFPKYLERQLVLIIASKNKKYKIEW